MNPVTQSCVARYLAMVYCIVDKTCEPISAEVDCTSETRTKQLSPLACYCHLHTANNDFRHTVI